MRVLLMPDGFGATLACIQSLGRLGHTVILATSGVPTPMAYSSFVAKRVRPPAFDATAPETRVAALVRMVVEENVDVVIPIHDEDACLVARARELFPRIAAFVTSSSANVAMASDKIATLRIAAELGIRTPPSIALESAAEIPAAIAQLGLPAFIKVPVATASLGTYRVQTRGEAKKLAERLAGPILVQSDIPGNFLGMTGFAENGRLVEHFAFQVPAGVSTAGTPAIALSLEAENLHDMLAAICRRLEWTGGIDIDAQLGLDGKAYLLEINPRLSGTLVFADKLGIDLPRCYIDCVAGTGYAPLTQRPPAGTLFLAHDAEAAEAPEIRKLARLLKRQHPMVDDLYAGDAGYTAARATIAAQRLGRA